MIEQNSIESLKNSIDIVDVIGSYIELRKAGANYKANCPFHGEKTPSFVVSPSKQIYHCFGCGVGGDAIKFVMESEKINYPEAIEKIASMFNFSLNYTKGNSDYSDAKRALEVMQKYYKSNLANNQSSMQYLLDRKITKESIEKFGIGYVPDGQHAMAHLSSMHIPLPQAQEAGIIAKGEDGRYYARLSQRITFPIYSPSGSLVGFGGRTTSNHPAKYINSPQTKLFNKSRLLYGYDIAKQSIYKKKKIVICEGYLDVIMFHQAGFSTAVATLGTALTAEHLPILRKGEPDVILAYDGDKAGVAAALKAARLLGQHGFEGGVVLFPDGKDPADMVANGQSQEILSILMNAKPLVPFVLEKIVQGYDITNPNQKEAAFAELKGYLEALTPIVKDAYIPEAARLLGVQPGLFGSNRDNSQIRQRFTNQIHRSDPEWQSIIKSVMDSPQLLQKVTSSLPSDVLGGGYGEAIISLQNGDTSHPLLMEILIDEKIPLLNDSELTNALLKQLELYYRKIYKQMTTDPNIPFKKKVYIRNKIQQDIIPKLKRGDLVEYESDFII